MKRILLIRFSALGDVAMLAPVVREAAGANPDCEFTVLSRPMCAPLFEGLAENVHFKGVDVEKDYKGIGGLLRLFNKLDNEFFDCVCDMHDVLRTKVLRKLFRLNLYKVYKINKHRELRKIITAEGDKKVLRQLPTAFDNYREVLLKAGLACPEINFGYSAFSPNYKIGIAPFAAHEGKIYPLEKMEEVLFLLSTLCDSSQSEEWMERNQEWGEIYLFSAPGEERKLMRRWAEKYSNVKLAADVCSGLKEELQLMAKLDVMLTMDSANMHLASLMGTRVVSIWGATHPYAGFLGWGQRMEDCIQRSDLKCRPCSIYGNKPCLRGDMACMDISPDDVRKHLTSFLREKD